MEVIDYAGWKCVRIVSGDVEALVTIDVGPRVIRLGFVGGPNEIHEAPDQRGLRGGSEYRSYGGHRLWIAPEAPETYYPENESVEVGQEGDWITFRSAPDARGLQRELRVRSAGDGAFELEHRVHNLGDLHVTFAPWALTVMSPGGECFFPQEPFVSHTENYLPVRPMVLWGYTNMSDPRWTWGSRLIRLRHDGARGPQKVGAFVSQGWAAYRNGDRLFVKRFPTREGNYPDYGCNFETFTREDMLEVESLGMLQEVHRGDHASLRESWLLTKATLPEDEDALAEALAKVAGQCPAV